MLGEYYLLTDPSGRECVKQDPTAASDYAGLHRCRMELLVRQRPAWPTDPMQVWAWQPRPTTPPQAGTTP